MHRQKPRLAAAVAGPAPIASITVPAASVMVPTASERHEQPPLTQLEAGGQRAGEATKHCCFEDGGQDGQASACEGGAGFDDGPDGRVRRGG